VAPAGTSRPIIDRLATQIGKLITDPSTDARLASMALEPLAGSTPDSFAEFIKSEIARWTDIVRNTGAQPK
jgi:tripartite-type tricarboxylate transporter receptor subunit TctC